MRSNNLTDDDFAIFLEVKFLWGSISSPAYISANIAKFRDLQGGGSGKRRNLKNRWLYLSAMNGLSIRLLKYRYERNLYSFLGLTNDNAEISFTWFLKRNTKIFFAFLFVRTKKQPIFATTIRYNSYFNIQQLSHYGNHEVFWQEVTVERQNELVWQNQFRCIVCRFEKVSKSTVSQATKREQESSLHLPYLNEREILSLCFHHEWLFRERQESELYCVLPVQVP